MADNRLKLGMMNEGSMEDEYLKRLERMRGPEGAPGGSVGVVAGPTGQQAAPDQAAPAASKGMDAATAKAGIDALSGVMNAYMQSQFLAKEGQREAQGKAEGVKARGKAQAEMGTAAQTAGGLSDLMALYRNQYARRLT